MGLFDKIQDTISSATEQTKAKAQDVQLKREKAQKLTALGEQAYGLYLNGQLTNQELAGACQEVADLDRRIAEAEAAVGGKATAAGASGSAGIRAPTTGSRATSTPASSAAGRERVTAERWRT